MSCPPRESSSVPSDQGPGQSRVALAGRKTYLIDRWGRAHTDLRISVTDRCNLRCFYCMPPYPVPLAPREALLDFEEIEGIVRVAIQLGIRKVRLTGGEPLVRKDLPELVRRLASLPGLEELTMTTNGTLLAEHAVALRKAGLHRINISLDTLDRRQFQLLTGQDALPQVLRGIEAAQSAGFSPIKLNALAIRGITENQIIPLVQFALQRQVELRFIEFMPIGPTGQWSPERVLPAQAILELLRQQFGSVEPVDGSASGEADLPELSQAGLKTEGQQEKDPNSGNLHPQQLVSPQPPGQQYRLGGTGARIGIIPSLSQPFCATCCRLRLTALGELRNCLFGQTGWDLRGLLRRGGTEEELAQVFRAAVEAKPLRPTHHLHPTQTNLLMCQIGG